MKIKDVKPKGDIKESGYYQVVGNEAFAEILRKVQSTTISNGIELEKIIYSNVKFKKFNKINFDEFIDIVKNATTDLYFKSISIGKEKFTINSIIFSGKNKMILDSAYYSIEDNTLYLGEIKNGMGLDTKKSEKEIDSLSELRKLCKNYLKLNIEIFIVLFICTDLSHASIKTDRKDFLKYTGKEYCEKIGISYDEIKKIRSEEGQENLENIVTEMYKIPEIKNIINKIKKEN